MKQLVNSAIAKLTSQIENAKRMKRKHRHEFCQGEERVSYWDDKLADLEYRLARIKMRFRPVEFRAAALTSLYSRAA